MTTRLLLFALVLLNINPTVVAFHSTITCLSWDGVVADTVDWRIEQGIQAAHEVWPSELLPLSTTTTTDDATWLRNKMKAVAPYLKGTSYEYALLARMLLEEQQLDPSVGKRGKYASKFHPQGSMKSIAIPSARSSRPLTVGEIQANWIDNLLDTLTVKYSIDRKNPVPILQNCISELNNVEPSPEPHPLIIDAIRDCPSQVIVTVPSASEAELASSMLPELHVATSIEDVTDAAASIVVVGADHQVLQHLCETQAVRNYVGANWASLQKTRRFASPQLLLSLASWTSSATQQNQANMDPAFNVVTQQEVLEMTSARIVKPQ